MEKQKIKIKRDRPFKERGSYARIINVKCAKCNNILFWYQKDGPGWLKRCYLNRIISDKKLHTEKKLICPSCKGIIGILKKHVFRSDGITPDGRWAYELIRGKFKRTYGGQKIK